MSPTCSINGGTGINTALGCLRVDSLGGLLAQILGWAVSVGGGIALMLIVLAGFQIVTSGGDPKKVQAAKELLTSAITGLLLVIFSLVIMNFFGVTILGLGPSTGFEYNLSR